MTEDDLEGAVMDLCKLLGLYVHHCRPAKTEKGWRTPIRGTPGFVDLMICGRRGALFRELKSEAGRVAPDQRKWLDRLFEAGTDAEVWRPRDLATGRIKRELEAIR